MKKLKKLACIVLSSVMAFSIAACSGDNGGGNNVTPGDDETPTTTAPQYTVTEPEHHFVDESLLLHKVRVTESDREFVDLENGTSDYTIVTSSDSAATRAAVFIQTHVEGATGVRLDVVDESEIADYEFEDSKLIVVGSERLFEAAWLTMPDEDYGASGYYIKTQDNSVFLMAKAKDGYHEAGLCFCRNVLGYDMFDERTVIYEKDGATLPDMEIVEKPDFSFKIRTQSMSSTQIYGMGLADPDEVVFAGEGIGRQHNTLQWLPTATYQASHPEWFSTSGQQLCYTARGDEASRQLMAETLGAKVVDILNRYPNIFNVSITQMDGHGECGCDACAASRALYGGDAGMQVQFINMVDDYVNEHIERDYRIMFFAYVFSLAPPATKDASGEWHPVDDTVFCNDNVVVYIAPIYADWTHSFYESKNLSTAESLHGWQACTNTIYYWLYETDYTNYLYPYNTFESMIETYRFCKTTGAEYVFTEGQAGQGGGYTVFTNFKTYLNSKVLTYVNTTYEELVDKFFGNFYGPAGAPMLQFFNELQTWCRYNEANFPSAITGSIYDSLEQARLWPKGVLDNWLALCDEARELLEPLRKTDPEMYEVYNDHITCEEIFPLFAEAKLYSSYFSASERMEVYRYLKEQCAKLNITMEREGGSLQGTFDGWGV